MQLAYNADMLHIVKKITAQIQDEIMTVLQILLKSLFLGTAIKGVELRFDPFAIPDKTDEKYRGSGNGKDPGDKIAEGLHTIVAEMDR
jgi:hypothetical protein